jgi:hypothetical protein
MGAAEDGDERSVGARYILRQMGQTNIARPHGRAVRFGQVLETFEPVKGGSLLVHFSETIATETGGRLRCNHRMSLECLAIRWHKS